MTKEITVATDYTKYPGPRYDKLGSGSGEGFRDKLLIPALKENDQVVVNLDGTRGYGSSFLEEAFGGAVRKNIPLSKENLRLVSEDVGLVEEIWEYITRATNGPRG